MRMNRIAAVVVVLCGMSLAGCSGSSAKVTYDKAVDFSNLATYAWKPGRMVGLTERGFDEQRVDESVRKIIDAALQAKGFKAADAGAASFRVTYQVVAEEQVAVSYVDQPYIRHTSGGVYVDSAVSMGMSAPVTTQYDAGTLIIEVLDPASDRLLWRGHETRTILKDATPAQREARLEEVVNLLLAKFPPK